MWFIFICIWGVSLLLLHMCSTPGFSERSRVPLLVCLSFRTRSQEGLSSEERGSADPSEQRKWFCLGGRTPGGSPRKIWRDFYPPIYPWNSLFCVFLEWVAGLGSLVQMGLQFCWCCKKKKKRSAPDVTTLCVFVCQVRKTLDATMQTLQDMLTVEDFDVSEAFQHSQSTESVKSASSDSYMSKANISKRRANQQETEGFYFTVSSQTTLPRWVML